MLLFLFFLSRHLATTVVASFIKRLSQLSLFSPITITPAILLIIFNGLQNHPHCRVLINCKQKKSQKLNNIQSDDNSLPNVFNVSFLFSFSTTVLFMKMKILPIHNRDIYSFVVL